jgi:hypothetical protein
MFMAHIHTLQLFEGDRTKSQEGRSAWLLGVSRSFLGVQKIGLMLRLAMVVKVLVDGKLWLVLEGDAYFTI